MDNEQTKVRDAVQDLKYLLLKTEDALLNRRIRVTISEIRETCKHEYPLVGNRVECLICGKDKGGI